MAYAIIETGGKQMRVEPGRFYDVERLIGDPETPVTIDKVRSEERRVGKEC